MAYVTKSRSYSKDFEDYFGSRGFIVRRVLPTRSSLSKLRKFADRTQPEGIVIDADYVPVTEIVSFMEGTKTNPDLWLVPVVVTTGNSSSTGSNNGSMTASAARVACLCAGVHACLPRGTSVEEKAACLSQVQAIVVGAASRRRRLEQMVKAMQEAIVDLRMHRRPLLPSTMILMDGPPPLTSTQQEVLNMVARGMTDAQIAYSMQVKVNVVRYAVNSLFQLLNVENRGELIRVALDNDLLTE